MQRLFFTACFSVLSIFGSVATAAEGLWGEWRLTKESVQGKVLRDQAGENHARIDGTPTYDDKNLGVIQLGSEKATLAMMVEGAEELPRDRLTLSAWVKMGEASRRVSPIISTSLTGKPFRNGWSINTFVDGFEFVLTTKGDDGAPDLHRLSGPQTFLTQQLFTENFSSRYAQRRFYEQAWYHVVGTYDGQTMRLYVDGIEVDRKKVSGEIVYHEKTNLNLGGGTVTIARKRAAPETSWVSMSGLLEQASLYRHPLNRQEVERLFAARSEHFPGIVSRHPKATDWPTYMRDNWRSGTIARPISMPLQLKWVHVLKHKPAPAWPDPTVRDYYHRGAPMPFSKLVFDRSASVIAVGKSVYFGSSVTNKVHCLDLETGQEKWHFFAGGPIRLAPTYWQGLLLFGSDDGSVYCLSADTGTLKWKVSPAPRKHFLPGNQRIISMWPIRSGVLVHDGKAYFGAGLFPEQGLYLAVVDARTGKWLSKERVPAEMRGYLSIKEGQLFAKRGRAPRGSLLGQLMPREKTLGPEFLPKLRETYRHCMVSCQNAKICGGDGEIVAFAPLEYETPIWRHAIEGKCYTMAVVGDNLLASTDEGRIYCFSKTTAPVTIVKPKTVSPQAHARRQVAEEAKKITERTGIQKGYGLLIGAENALLAYELAKQTDLHLIIVESNASKVRQWREKLDAYGCYGKSVDIHHVEDVTNLPFTDYIFNLIVASESQANANKNLAQRLLHPMRGFLVTSPNSDNWIRRDPLKNTGEWTQLFGNPGNLACSEETNISDETIVQWFGRPGARPMVDRHHRGMSPVSKDGRLFTSTLTGTIVVDAYNGAELWRKNVEGYLRIGMMRDCGQLAVDSDYAYLAGTDTCHVIDVDTGETVRQLKVPPEKSGNLAKREWGYLTTVRGTLVGSGQIAGASLSTMGTGTRLLEHDNRESVIGQDLFGYNPKNGKLQWHYAGGTILNSSICANEESLFFVESLESEVKNDPEGRFPLYQFCRGKLRLVAIDLKTGQIVFQKPISLDFQQIFYALCRDGRLLLVGSWNGEKMEDGTLRAVSAEELAELKKKSRRSGESLERYLELREKIKVCYEQIMFDANSGTKIWTNRYLSRFSSGGAHGEQWQHPVVIGDEIYLCDRVVDWRTGQVIPNRRGISIGGCGVPTASRNGLMFSRYKRRTGVYDIETKRGAYLTSATRAGCYINIIPAAGLILVPEASSGCSCGLITIQTSMAFRSARPEELEHLEEKQAD